jgi:diaminopimelate decarboxylase
VEALPDGVTPAYVYFEDYLMGQINSLKQAFRPEGFSDVKCNIRYAMKAQSNVNILKIFAREAI